MNSRGALTIKVRFFYSYLILNEEFLYFRVGHCPGLPGNCSGHGVCQNSSCVCDNDHLGERCEIKRCPND